jgi:hypothetical protein
MLAEHRPNCQKRLRTRSVAVRHTQTQSLAMPPSEGGHLRRAVVALARPRQGKSLKREARPGGNRNGLRVSCVIKCDADRSSSVGSP